MSPPSGDVPRHRRLAERLRRLAARVERDEVPPDALEALAEAAAQCEAAPPPGSAAPGAGERGAEAGVVRIWSDGSCAPNPGPGGWAAIIDRDGQREEVSGAAAQSTNNIMEMTAAIEALRHTWPGERIHVATDSRYLMDGITRWLPGWKRRDWRKADGGAVLNRELWMELDALASRRRLTWEWVAGHTGHPENERADRLANAARERLKRRG